MYNAIILIDGCYNMIKNKKALFADTDPPNLLDFGDSFFGMGPRRKAKFKMFLFIKQGMCCFYCKQKMIIKNTLLGEKQAKNLATFEHLVDAWENIGGRDNSLKNIVLACHNCNNIRNQKRQYAAMSFYKKHFDNFESWCDFSYKAKPDTFIKTFGFFPNNFGV